MGNSVTKQEVFYGLVDFDDPHWPDHFSVSVAYPSKIKTLRERATILDKPNISTLSQYTTLVAGVNDACAAVVPSYIARKNAALVHGVIQLLLQVEDSIDPVNKRVEVLKKRIHGYAEDLQAKMEIVLEASKHM